MTADPIHIEGELFLGRADEQDRFREALRSVQREASVVEKVKDWVAEKDPTTLPFVFLLYGEGGMGKTRLAQRLRQITLDEPTFKGHFRAIWLDWERRKDTDYRLAARDAVSPELVFEHLYATFRDEGFGREFDPYEKAVKDRANAETKVAQALDRTAESGDRYAALRELGGKGLAWLVRSGLVGGTPIPVPQEPTAKAFEAIIGGGAEALGRARENATTLLRATLTDPDDFDLFTFPNEILARRLADGIRASASKKPIVLVLDTYEIADRADFWLRLVMKRAGPRVAWVIAGRDNLADSRSRYGAGSFTGYRAEFQSDRLRVFPLGEFSVGDVADYFAWRAAKRPLEPKEAEAIHRATLGIPLAVREAASIWAGGASLDDIVSDMPHRAPREHIVKVMTERFLLHCFNEPNHADDKARLYALALAHRPDPDLLAAMLKSDDLERDLSDLERRHSFVFVDAMKLHNSVAAFFREYLLHDLRRKSNEVRGLHERAVSHLQTQQKAREAIAPTLEARVADERWTAATLGLAHHGLWLDEDKGWAALMPALAGGLTYDRGFARSLVETAEPLAATFTQAGKRRLRALQNGLSPSPGVDEDAVLLADLEVSARLWPKDDCAAERRAVLDFLRGQLLYRREKYVEALGMYEGAERGLPEKGDELRKQLGRAYSDVGLKLGIALFSEEARLALSRAVELQPDQANYRLVLGIIYGKLGRYDDAIATLQRALELDPKNAFPHSGLGITYKVLGRHDDAVAEYQRAIELDPRFAYSHNGLGDVYRALGHHDDALAEYQRAIELDPKDAAPHNGLGSVYHALGHHDEALAAFQRASELDPKLAAPHNGLGNVYHALGRPDDAIAAYQRAIELDPKFAYPHNNLGLVYRNLGRHGEAIAAYQRAIELDPKYAAPHDNLSTVFRLQGRIEDAVSALRRATELDPNLATAQSSLIACYRQLGRETEAAGQIKIASELMAKEREYNRACFESICGNVEEALALLKVALEKKETSLEWARQDPDFDFIRDDPRFKALVGD